MATYDIPINKLAETIAKEGEKQKRAVKNGMVAAARRFEALLVSKTKEAGKVDRGQFLAGWRTVIRTALSSELGQVAVANDSPVAGIIELGARPHPVSEAGREAIARWFMRKHGLSEAEAKVAAAGVARKLRRSGQKGTFLVRDNMPEVSKFLAAEIARRIGPK